MTMKALRAVQAIVWLSLACLAAFAARAAEVTLQAERSAAIDSIARRVIEQHKAAGMAVAVMQDEELIFAADYGFANLEHRVPVTPDTVFRIASVTKQFTAAAVMLLVERQQIGLDDKLAKFFPQCSGDAGPTVRQMLLHTSGIRDYTEQPEFSATTERHNFTTEQFVRHICELQPLYDFEPGTAWKYSNSGYYLLGAIVEQVSGRSLQAFFASEIFARLGMSQTALDHETDVVPNRASGYRIPDDRPGEFRNADLMSMSVPGPAGALRSTVRDLALWHRALFAGQVVKPATLELMITPGRLTNGALASSAIHNPKPAPESAAKTEPVVSDYGMGLNIMRRSAGLLIGHSGGISGFASWLFTFPDQHRTVVVLTNTRESSHAVARATEEIWDLVGRWN